MVEARAEDAERDEEGFRPSSLGSTKKWNSFPTTPHVERRRGCAPRGGRRRTNNLTAFAQRGTDGSSALVGHFLVTCHEVPLADEVASGLSPLGSGEGKPWVPQEAYSLALGSTTRCGFLPGEGVWQTRARRRSGPEMGHEGQAISNRRHRVNEQDPWVESPQPPTRPPPPPDHSPPDGALPIPSPDGYTGPDETQ